MVIHCKRTAVEVKSSSLCKVDNGIYKAKEHERSELLLTKGRERNSIIIPFVHTHNPRNQNVNCINTTLQRELGEGIENTQRVVEKSYPNPNHG